MKALFAATWFCLCQVALGASLYSHSPASPFLVRAHEAYLKGDFSQVLEAVKAQLASHPEDKLSEQNALHLVDQAFRDAGQDGIDANWHLPKEFSLFRINSARGNRNGKVSFVLSLRADGTFKAVDQIRIVKFPGDVLLDKRAGLATCRQYGGNRLDFNERLTCHSPYHDSPIEDGLYTLTIEFDGGKRVSGWFVLSGLTPESSPDILSPKPDDELLSSRPVFRWSHYLPDPVPGERSLCTIFVTPQDNQSTRWFLRLPFRTGARLPPDPFIADTAKVGSTIGASHLDTGDYLLVVRCESSRRFGDLLLGSERHASRTFTIKRP